MKSVSTKVYTIDELTETARQKAIDNWTANDDLPFMADAMAEHLTDTILPKYKLTCEEPEVRYSLGYSQGDGASFTGRIEWGAWYGDVELGHLSNFYCHYNTVKLDTLYSTKTDREAPQATVDKVEELVREACRDLEKYGYDYIEYEHEPSHVIEEMQANEMLFYADGGTYYER